MANFTHYGRWKKVITHTAGISGSDQYDATASNAGVAGIITYVGTSGSITMTGGGSVALEHLQAGREHEFSVLQSNVASGSVYLLYDRKPE